MAASSREWIGTLNLQAPSTLMENNSSLICTVTITSSKTRSSLVKHKQVEVRFFLQTKHESKQIKQNRSAQQVKTGWNEMQ